MSSKKNKETKKIVIKSKNNGLKSLLILFVFSLLLASVYLNNGGAKKYIDSDIALNIFEQNFEENIYSEVLIDGSKAIATYTGSTVIENGVEKIKRDIIILPENDSLKDLGLKNQDISTKILIKDKSSDEFWSEMIPTIIGFVLFFVIAIVIINKMGGVANNAITFGKSRAKLFDKDKDKVLFKDVAGADEEKEELSELVDFLKSPKKYKNMGAKIPKGVLLVGPPGTGKTLLARAVAGESGVPFLSISGSEFVEMFVGVGASRVRDLFENAKKMAPAIIFIDEIDAIGKKRGPGLGGGHDEREQTLNQILTEMDGFDNETNIIVMGATNRADVLDKALLRPGRFDRKITVNLPNINDREKILEVHSKGKPMEKDINFRSFASSTVGFSGADLGNLLNESAIISARNNEKKISKERIQEAFERLVMGLRKKSFVMNDLEKKVTAYHEVGHALVGKMLPNTDPVHKISIISRGGALGVTWFLPEKDEVLTSKAKFLDELATLFGGRAAEEIFFGKDKITTGASNDIERATKIARAMVTRYGMYEDIGTENFAGDSVSGNHLGAEGSRSAYSDKTQESIDIKVRTILLDAYKIAIDIINKNKKLHDKISIDLIKKEEIDKEEFAAYFK